MDLNELLASAKKEFENNMNCFYYNEKIRPWHFLMLRDFRWYRKLTKGLWCRYEIEPGYFFWDRMHTLIKYIPVNKIEDYRKSPTSAG